MQPLDVERAGKGGIHTVFTRKHLSVGEIDAQPCRGSESEQGYSDKALDYRGKVIARHETMVALDKSRDDAFRQQIYEGELRSAGHQQGVEASGAGAATYDGEPRRLAAIKWGAAFEWLDTERRMAGWT